MSDESSEQTKKPVKATLLILWRIILVTVILSIGVGLMSKLAGLKEPPKQSKSATEIPLVVTQPLVIADHPVTLTGFGSVQNGKVAVIAPEVSGRIVWRADLDPGEIATKDQPLIRIDDRDYHVSIATTKARIAATQAEIKQAQTQLESTKNTLKQRKQRAALSQKEADRLDRLFSQKKLGTQSAMDAAKRLALMDAEAITAAEELIAILPHRIDAAKATVKQLEAQQELDRLKIFRCEILAPFNGRVQEFSAEVGSFAAMGAPIITLADDTDRELTVALRADQAAQHLAFAVGTAEAAGGWYALPKPAKVEIRDPTAAHSPGQPTWTGVVDRISAVNPATRMVELIVRPQTSEDAPPLPSGTFCEVRIPGKTITCFAVPRNALRADHTVFVNVQDQLSIRKINVLHVDRDTLLIDGDLKAGESLIVNRLAAPLSGMALRTKPEAQAENEQPPE